MHLHVHSSSFFECRRLSSHYCCLLWVFRSREPTGHLKQVDQAQRMRNALSSQKIFIAIEHVTPHVLLRDTSLRQFLKLMYTLVKFSQLYFKRGNGLYQDQMISYNLISTSEEFLPLSPLAQT